MFILKKFWGSGISEALLRTCITTLSDWGIKRLEATVRCQNLRGLSFYKKMGFEIEGTRRSCASINGSFHDEYYIARLF